MKPLSPRSSFTALLLTLFVFGSTRPSPTLAQAPADRSGPTFFFRVLGEAVKRDRLDVMLKVLPEEYSSEPQALIREAAATVDPELFAMVTDLYKEATRVATAKADLLWDCETMKQQRVAVQQMGPTVDRNMFKALLALNETVAGSQLMDLEAAKGLEFPAFLANDGGKILRSLKDIVKATPAPVPDPVRGNFRIFPDFSSTYQYQFDKFTDSVDVFFGKEMFSAFGMEKEGDQWVPTDLQESLESVKEGRKILKGLRPEVMAELKGVVGPLVTQLRETLGKLEAATSTEEVDEALQGFMGIAGMMGMAALDQDAAPPAFRPDPPEAMEVRQEVIRQRLDNAVEIYTIEFGKRPSSLKDLVAKKFIKTVPCNPQGNPAHYDPKTGEISFSKLGGDGSARTNGQAMLRQLGGGAADSASEFPDLTPKEIARAKEKGDNRRESARRMQAFKERQQKEREKVADAFENFSPEVIQRLEATPIEGGGNAADLFKLEK